MDWNDTAEPFPADMLVHQLFEAQAIKTPGAPAVEYRGETMTYAELDEQSLAVASLLRDRGAQPDTVVGLCVERSAKMVVGVLGVLRSGAACMPLEPSFPEERLAYMLDDSGASILLGEEATAATCNSLTESYLMIEESGRCSFPTEVASPGTRPEDLAYVIYTSGSTGKPKGVAIEHRNLINLLHSMGRRLNISDHEVVLSVAPFGFDVALPDWYWALMFGGRVIVVEGPVIHDPESMIQKILDTRPSHIQGPPTFWEMLVGVRTRWPEDIRIVSTGEHINETLREELRERNRVVWNLYGPSETTVWSTACELHADRNPDSIGVPIGNTTLHIVNQNGELAKVGEKGELLIGGAGLARGYLNQAELTAERFSPMPEVGPERLYRTGDIVRRNSDGTVAYLGRRDHQVKIRGFRIELGEVDATLCTHPDVRSAVTVLRKDRPGDARLISYIVRRRWRLRRVKFWEYRDYLERILPLHMIPAGIEVLPKMPLNSNGKIDRSALPQPSGLRRELGSPYSTPEGKVESRLVEIWEKVLKIDGIGANDNFFDLGGHSVLALEIVGKVRKAFGKPMTVTSVFGAPTIREFAKLLDSQGSTVQ